MAEPFERVIHSGNEDTYVSVVDNVGGMSKIFISSASTYDPAILDVADAEQLCEAIREAARHIEQQSKAGQT